MNQQNRLRTAVYVDLFSLTKRTQLLFQSNLQNYRKTFYSTYNLTIDVDHAHK